MPPRRGYASATYYWDYLPNTVSDRYPFLPASGYLYMHQTDGNKQLFTALITNSSDNSYQELQFDSKDRESLELALISAGTVNVEIDTEYEAAPPSQKRGSLPYLTTNGFPNLDIIVLAKPQYDEASAIFSGKAAVGDSYYDGDADNYVIPLFWELYSLNSATEQKGSICPELTAKGNKIGTVSGHLILTRQILQDGCDPVSICDSISEDLRYVMTVMYGSTGPLNKYNEPADEQILYIHEIKMESDYEAPELKGRVIRELPWLCMKLMHIRPQIISYCISELQAEETQNGLAASYMQNGFVGVVGSNVIYAYTE